MRHRRALHCWAAVSVVSSQMALSPASPARLSLMGSDVVAFDSRDEVAVNSIALYLGKMLLPLMGKQP